jgi:hypothetical protein
LAAGTKRGGRQIALHEAVESFRGAFAGRLGGLGDLGSGKAGLGCEVGFGELLGKG